MNTQADMTLRARSLLAAFAAQGVEPRGVADDSRAVQPGDLFLAYPGARADGRRFIADAIARGAVAVLWETCREAGDDFSWDPAWRVAQYAESGVRRLAGPLAHAVYGWPCERLSLIAVTGTNGKTTITQWLGRAHPRPCATIGTLGAGFVDALDESVLTTPQAPVLAGYLARFAAAGAQACAIEASSVGIEEGRLDGARVDVAVFSNLTRDHLDYHGTMEAYAAAKAKLFAWPHLRLAVVNLDDPFGRQLAGECIAPRVIGYTQQGAGGTPAVVAAEDVEETPAGLRFRLCLPNGRVSVETGLLGRYNLSNLLAVAAVLYDAGLAAGEIGERLAALPSPPGRLERLGGVNEPLVVVDYAHTPDALENALVALRGVARARGAGLTVLFGCGGDRDPGKRPQMGAIAARLADRVVITSDNPRSEDPLAILTQVSAGAPGATVIADRAAAIRAAILAAHPAEVVLLAGKGHEPYQEIAGERRPFSDLGEAAAALAARRETQA